MNKKIFKDRDMSVIGKDEFRRINVFQQEVEGVAVFERKFWKIWEANQNLTWGQFNVRDYFSHLFGQFYFKVK